jgi:hypothetical protein
METMPHFESKKKELKEKDGKNAGGCTRVPASIQSGLAETGKQDIARLKDHKESQGKLSAEASSASGMSPYNAAKKRVVL